jgi:hypothetical protein
MPLPNISPPEPIRGLEPDSWANSTITVRFINIVERVLAQNDFSVEITRRLQALIDEIPDGLIRPLSDPGPDLAAWNHFIEPHRDQNWLQPPWFFVEHYLYRRIIAAVGHFRPGRNHGVDPFAKIKQDGLEHGLATIETLAERLDTWLQDDSPDQDRLKVLLYMDLWGNQSDLSLWPADNDPDEKPDHADLLQAQAYLLADDSVDVAEHLLDLDPERARVDIIVDNTAVEVVGDLIVADYLLSAELVAQVRLHLKVHPTFVSDATPKDVNDTITFLQQNADPCVRVLGERLRAHLRAGRLKLRSDFFWTSPLEGWKMPASLAGELAQADLVISKGDANYRRLLGDRHWAFTTPFAEIVSYFPAPLVALRTLKAELVSGLEPGQADSVAQKDPDWMVDGRWGLIQFHGG